MANYVQKHKNKIYIYHKKHKQVVSMKKYLQHVNITLEITLEI